MLLRNIDQYVGLWSGTRLIIKKMGKYALDRKTYLKVNWV